MINLARLWGGDVFFCVWLIAEPVL